MRLYQITSATEGGNGGFCRYHSLNSTCPCKTRSVASSRAKALFLIQREQELWWRRTVLGTKSFVTQRDMPVPKHSAASSSTQRLKGMIGSSKEKAAVFWSVVDSCRFKTSRMQFIFKYFMTILMLLYSPCMGACAKDGTVSGVEHAYCLKWAETDEILSWFSNIYCVWNRR